MRLFSALRLLFAASLLALIGVLLMRYFTAQPASSPGVLLAGPQAVAQRQAALQRERLPAEEGSAAQLLLQQEDELAQIRQWHNRTEKAPR